MKASIKILENNEGYTLLFAVLTATLVLGVAVFILSISRGQYLLASAARESTYAIYAADSGIECAAAVAANISIETGGILDCGGNTYEILGSGGMGITPGQFTRLPDGSIPNLYDVYQTSLYVGLSDNRCVYITFNKGFDSLKDGTRNLVTQIEARGYNFCTLNNGTWSPNISNPRVVERAIRLTYVGL